MPDFLDRLGDELQRAARAPGSDEPVAVPPPQRMPRSRLPRLRGAVHARSRWLLAGIVLLLAGAGGAAIAGGGKPDPEPAPPLAGGVLASGADARDLAQFAILRRAPGEADQIPPQSPVALSGSSGANLGLARRAQGFGAQRAWVVPGRGTLCLIAQWPARHGGGANCVPDASAAAGELVVVSGTTGARGFEFVAGLVPDGVSVVSVHLRGRGVTTAAVHEGVYMAAIAGSAAAVTFTGPHGAVKIEGIGLPVGSR
jgi:hypothetical protein